jgi:hypothetical protein
LRHAFELLQFWQLVAVRARYRLRRPCPRTPSRTPTGSVDGLPGVIRDAHARSGSGSVAISRASRVVGRLSVYARGFPGCELTHVAARDAPSGEHARVTSSPPGHDERPSDRKGPQFDPIDPLHARGGHAKGGCGGDRVREPRGPVGAEDGDCDAAVEPVLALANRAPPEPWPPVAEVDALERDVQSAAGLAAITCGSGRFGTRAVRARRPG